MKECANCGFLNDYGACDCPHSDKWYIGDGYMIVWIEESEEV